MGNLVMRFFKLVIVKPADYSPLSALIYAVYYVAQQHFNSLLILITTGCNLLHAYLTLIMTSEERYLVMAYCCNMVNLKGEISQRPMNGVVVGRSTK